VLRCLLLTALLAAVGLVSPSADAATPGPAAASTATRAVSSTPSRAGHVTRDHRIGRALRVARHQKGDRYKYGAEGPRRFDCSGLVYFATHRAGLTRTPRTSSEQAKYMRRIKRSHLQRGDFVFFKNRGGVYHVGFFLRRLHGAVYILHAPSPGNPVQKDRVWTHSWFAGTLRR